MYLVEIIRFDYFDWLRFGTKISRLHALDIYFGDTLRPTTLREDPNLISRPP